MYYFGYFALIITFIAALAGAASCLINLFRGHTIQDSISKHAHWLTSLGLIFASLALLHGLFWQDYRLQYVANYTDQYLELFYRLTAFWAGQPGSMLFWALTVSIFGTLFACNKLATKLSDHTKLWFWAIYYALLVFFALVLTTYSNPFIMQSPVPIDGNGLNPLLQNPGMIIHPPLLFLGYAGFAPASCLALAQCLSHEKQSIAWHEVTRNMLLWAWALLTAGILLGAWWAYMELGWGGYWAWDPVENSSLVPWLLATATLHSIKVKHLERYNASLIALTTISTFFATFLVRSGIIDSVHAFGQGAVGFPLACLVLFALLLTFWVTFQAEKIDAPMPDLMSKSGLLWLLSWFLIAIAVIITLATMWPVISKLFTQAPKGLDAKFYNQVCLPLASLVILLLCLCNLAAKHIDSKRKIYSIIVVAVALGTTILLYVLGFQHPVALLATAAAVGAFLGLIFLHKTYNWAALGCHVGLLLCTIGIAFSGPYSTEHDIYLSPGESKTLSPYTITLKNLESVQGPGYSALVAKLQINDGKTDKGILAPERRLYAKFGDMQFSEVATLPSLGTELYASLLGLTQDKQVLVRFSQKPLVNWLWIGGVLLSLCPLAALKLRAKSHNAETSEH